MQRKAVLLAVALLLLPAAFSQSNDNTLVTIQPRMALQGFNAMNPTGVHVNGTTMGGESNASTLISQFAVMNYTNKTVTSLEYGWRISTPLGCTDSTLPVRWETADARVTIAPNAEANIKPPDSLSRPGTSNELAEQARNSHTPVVLVTIGLLKVNFSDGSSWTDDHAAQSNNFDNGLAEKETGCHATTLEEVRAKQMRAKATQR
jgi:hypothetical protein